MSIKKRILIVSVLVVLVVAIGAGIVLTFWLRAGKGAADELTDEDLEQIDYVNDALEDMRTDRDFVDMDPDEKTETMLEVIEDLADEGMINEESIICDEDEHYITFEYTCGIFGGEFMEEEDPDCCSSFLSDNDSPFGDEQFFVSPEHRGCVLILDALVDSSDPSDFEVLRAFTSCGNNFVDLGFDTKLDTEVTLDDFQNFEGYDVVAFFIHGRCANFWSKGRTSLLKLDQRADDQTTIRYASDFLQQNVGIVEGRYVITPDFVRAHYGTRSTNLDDTIFYFGSCNQMGQDNNYCEAWTEVCPEIGVPAFVAFHNEIEKGYACNFFYSFTYSLITGSTARDSFDIAVSVRGDNDGAQDRAPGIACFRGDEWALIQPTPTPVEAHADLDEPADTEPEIPELQATALTAGDTVFFGEYEQDDDLGNGPEPIEWEVLSVEDDRVLLFSRYSLDVQPYNRDFVDVTWATCSLRQWLNNDFYSSAFSPEEQEQILLVTLTNPDNPYSGVDGGPDTTDRVFILSPDEIMQYFPFEELNEADNRYGTCEDLEPFSLTEYAQNQGTLGNVGGFYDHWWLRAPGDRSNEASYHGSTHVTGMWWYSYYVYNINHGVRPAIYVSTSDIGQISQGDTAPEEQDATWVQDGNYVVFGHYEQDNNLSNGAEPIEWEIVSESDGRMILISRYILDSHAYNDDFSDVTWETCSLRTWLNNDFLNAAFSPAEQAQLITTTLANNDNPYGALGGNSTEDRVFCLSVDEIFEYYDFDQWYQDQDVGYSAWLLREVTPYAISQGVWHNPMTSEYFFDESELFWFYTEDMVGMDRGTWWLRSPGSFHDTACIVYGDGNTGWTSSEDITDYSRGVRPCIVLSTE